MPQDPHLPPGIPPRPIPPPSPPSPPAAEHLTTKNNAVTLSAAIATSFVAPGPDADGHAIAALASGHSDGFPKTVIYAPALPGCSLRVAPSLADGAIFWEIGDAGGALELRWNAPTGHWALVSGNNYVIGLIGA